MRFIEFNIKYEVTDNSVMYLVYRLDDNGNITNGALSLREVQRGLWQAKLDVSDDYANIVYGYELLSGDRVVANEWLGTPHTLRFNCINRNYIVHDMWLDSPAGFYSRTNLFRFFDKTETVLDEPSINWYNRSVTFSVYATGLRSGERLHLVGDADVLGAWEPARALPMQQRVPNRWSVTFDVATLWSGALDYKFIAVGEDGSVRWEAGDNRHILLPNFEPGTNYFYQLDALSFDAPSLRIAGTVIPLFSLRSAHGWGIGDFGDIKLMADWLASTGQNILQLLPVNDTTVHGGSEDSYPYNCVSVFALNPIYTDMSQLPQLSKARRNAFYQKEREALNALPAVDYAKTYRLKINYLRELFDETGEEIRRIGHEFGAVTGRPRRCGWLDLVALKYAVMISGVTDLIMMKSDCLDTFETIKVCTSYIVDGQPSDQWPFDTYANIEPVYTEFKGWKSDLTHCRTEEELPQEFRDYIAFMEQYLGVPIKIISVGPDREATIMR